MKDIFIKMGYSTLKFDIDIEIADIDEFIFSKVKIKNMEN